MRNRYIPPPTYQHDATSGPVLLRDGRTAIIRPTQQSDYDLLIDFLKQISLDALTYRFFAEVSPESAADLLLREFENEEKVSLVVLLGEPPRIIATGEYVQEGEGSESAEVAFLVDNSFQGKGIGSLLLERLALTGVHRGLRKFRAFTLADNMQMLDVFRASGYVIESEQESGEVEVSFDIEPSVQMVERFESRERISTVASLVPLFRPRNVAVVGASSREANSPGNMVLANLVRGGFRGHIFAIHPEAAAQSLDVDTGKYSIPFTTFEEVWEPIDLAIIATRRENVVEAAIECGKNGVRALMVITTDMLPAQIADLSSTCQKYGMRLLGPGSLGVITTDPEVSLCASVSAEIPNVGSVGMSSQSGALGLAALEYATEMGIGLSNFASLGSKTDISSNDLMQYWEEDPKTNLILLYLESFGNPRRFARLARRVARKKPVLVVRPGRDQISETLFKQAGVIRAGSLEQMFDIAALLSNQPLPQGSRVGLLTNTLGAANLAAEILRSEGMAPVIKDLHSRASAQDYSAAARQLINEKNIDAAISFFVPLGYATVSEMSEAMLATLTEMKTAGIHIPVLYCLMTKERPMLRVGQDRVPIYRFPESAARALASAYTYSIWKAKPLGEIPNHAVMENEAREIASRRDGFLSAVDSQKILEHFGILTVVSHKKTGSPLQLSIYHDDLFGPVISLTLKNLPIGDYLLGSRLTPLTELEAESLVEPLNVSVDQALLKDLLLRVSRLVEEVASIKNLDLLVRQNGSVLEISNPNIEIQRV